MAAGFAASPELDPEPDPPEPEPSELDAPEPSELDAPELPDPEPESAELPPLAVGLTDEYRSLYQPPPLNCTFGAVNVRSRCSPQCGQMVNSTSENFWIFSVRRWQVVHSYS